MRLVKISSEEQKVVEQKTQEPGAPFPVEKQRGRRSYTSLLWWVPLLMFVLLLISVFSGRSKIEAWISHHVVHNQILTPVVPVIRPQPTPTQPSPIDTTATLFMNAMLRKDWASMWFILSPDAQQQWQGEKDFIHFEQAKFGSLQLISYINSPAQMHHTWFDPDTTQIYSNVDVLHISLRASAPQGLLSAPSNIALRKGLFHNTLFPIVYYQFNWRILLAGPADPDAPILVPSSPPTTKLLVPIFMYHHVSNLPVRNYLDYGLTVTTTNFNYQLDWLQQQGYHSITQTELFDALYYGKVLPTHPMILTFDDGYEDVYTDALPALLAHHYRGVFYIITGMIGGNYMTWPQVRKLAQDGMQVSSHTIHHVNIGQPPPWTTTQNELLASKQTLEVQLKQPVQFFCYPTGEPFHNDPVYEQQIVLADLFKDGYVAATLDPFSFDSVIQNAQTPYQLPRIRVSGGESMQLFTSILNSTLNIDGYRMANGYSD
ncbi:MAG TPA: polysaccharide deacetylase family protein [Ktedonobacteraceae bacterium]|nr:polysaccharide deacetylase family protein [Ktedonobacteraceae bacterium]